MSTDEGISTDEETSVEPRTDEHHNVLDEPEEREGTEKPEVTEEHEAKAKEMHKIYETDQETVTMPGTGGTVAGTAVNDWLDDDGNPKYSEDSKASDDGDQTADGRQP